MARLNLVSPESVIEILEYGISGILGVKIWWYTSLRKEVFFLNQKIFLVPNFYSDFLSLEVND